MIPIYRAKKLDSDEYVEGSYIEAIQSIIPTKLDFSIKNGKIDIHYSEFNKIKVIDPTTLAIHFPDMLDSQRNKIFASLQEDGKGGDCTFMQNGYNEVFCWDALNACIALKSKHYECKCFRNGNRNETTFNTYTIVGILAECH